MNGTLTSAQTSSAFKKSHGWLSDSVDEHTSPVNGTALAGHESPQTSRIDPPSALVLFVAATVLLLVGYTMVFALTLEVGFVSAISVAFSNVAPLALSSAATWWLLRRWILRLQVVGQTAAHVVLAPIFATTWFGSTLVFLAVARTIAGHPFSIGTFGALAFVWQTFQGIILYALVVAVTYALRGGRRASQVTLMQQPAPVDRYLTRTGDEFVPIEVDDISFIRGAQDYAEVTLSDGRTHLVRLSLGELQARLPARRFTRVHRSTIVNLAHLVRAEPIGSGRMALHMRGGTVETSRSGTQMLRGQVL